MSRTAGCSQTSRPSTSTAGTTANPIRRLRESLNLTDVICAKKRPRGLTNHTKAPTPLGMRWTIERTNSWLTNYGPVRRNTDRRTPHGIAQLCPSITLIITIKLINWRNRWNINQAPIRERS